MKIIKKKIDNRIKLLACIVASIIIGVMVSLSLSLLLYLKAGDDKGIINIDPAWILGSETVTLNDEGAYVVNEGGLVNIFLPEEIYVNKFSYKYMTEEQESCGIKFYNWENNEDSVSEVLVIDSLFSKGSLSVISAKMKTRRIEFLLSDINVSLRGFVIDNSFQFNPVTSIFCSLGIFVLLFLFFFRKESIVPSQRKLDGTSHGVRTM